MTEQKEKYFKVVQSYPSNDIGKLSEEELQRLIWDGTYHSLPMKVLQSPSKTVCPLYVAIINHDEAEVERLIKHQVDPSAIYLCEGHPWYKTERNWTYLSYAVFENYMPTIKVLLADPRVV